jgi:hypothetical protein
MEETDVENDFLEELLVITDFEIILACDGILLKRV